MASRNVFFNNFESKGEQDLIEDLVIESIQIYGIDAYYMPKTYYDYDNLYGESDLAIYKEYYTVPMYSIYVYNVIRSPSITTDLPGWIHVPYEYP